MKNNNNKELVIESEKKFLKVVAKWTFALIIVIAILFLLTTPLRGHAANDYVAKGDQYLSEKKYLGADLAYQKALALNSRNKDAAQRRSLVTEAEGNVQALENFYNELGDSSQEALLSKINAFPANETEVLKLSKELIEQSEFQLAIVPAETATQMAPDYALCWQYLGIANQKTADLVDLSPVSKEKYVYAAKAAFAKAKELDPEIKL